MDWLLLRGALWRKRGAVLLAVLAVAIGASVASALLQVSGDVSRKLSRELRALGPNLLLVPEGDVVPGGEPALAPAGRWLDEAEVRSRLARARVDGVPLLYVVATATRGVGPGETVQLVGADLAAAQRLHPSWNATAEATSLMGVRLMSRLGVEPGERLTVAVPGGRSLEIVVGAPLAAGGADDDAWWVPLADAQRLAGLPGRVSLAQARVSDAGQAAAATRRLEEGGGMRALVLHALSATEARLLQRMRRLMALVTIAALVAGGFSAFGTLTDLALERRREIALMKALGATAAEVVRQFAAESLVIGLAGGIAGWLLGLVFAEIIGRQVFTSALAMRWDVPFVVLVLSLAVSAVAGLGPIRLALRVEPAAALKGD